ncbi:MAG: PD40 domain-containing protein [Candidatus Riflebacteria bacterium]|nr:PD40 domain-containing protein [Candidatus Riflebacteria bacterium]
MEMRINFFSGGASFARMILVVATLFIASFVATSPTLAAEGSISFMGSQIHFSYQPRLRSALKADLTPASEVGRLNLITNLIDNYLLYLMKLEKIKLEKPLNLEYSPDGSTEAVSPANHIFFTDLGINAVLKTVNAALLEIPGNSKKFLLSDRAMLETIRDQLPRRVDTMEQAMGLSNLSDLIPGLAPDMDFTFLSNTSLVSIRPEESNNALFLLSMSGSSSVLLKAGQFEYGNLLPSPGGTFLAFTDGGKPCVIAVNNVSNATGSTAPQPLFSGGNKLLLDWCWSPREDRLAGIVLDRITGNREIFVFEAAKNHLSPIFDDNTQVQGNYQFAFPYWSPDGHKLLFCSGNELHLADIDTGKVYPRVVTTPDLISEVLWSPDGLSFAIVEVCGLARSKTEFDNLDFPRSTLRRFRVSASGSAVEDMQQRHAASETIKLVSFWSKDRVLFLEGTLRPQRIASPLWNLSDVMTAHLTPSPGSHATGADNVEVADSMGILDLALGGCFAFKNIETRFKNIYDAGFGHMNHLFAEKLVTSWFIDINVPEGFPRRLETFCLRPHPYPFPERNIVYFTDLPKDKLTPLLDMLTAYNLRRFEISPDIKMIAFLSNSRGPLSLWCGALSLFSQVNMPAPPKFDEASGAGTSETTEGGEGSVNASGSSSNLPSPTLPGTSITQTSGPDQSNVLPAPSLPSPGLPAPGLPSPVLPSPSFPSGNSHQ